MNKSALKFGVAGISILLIVIGFKFESDIQARFPTFRADLLLSGMVLMAGTFLSIVIRHFAIFLATVAMTVAIPFLVKWFVWYWPYASQQFNYFG